MINTSEVPGDEKALAERWKKLLYAESRLQAQRDEITAVLDEDPNIIDVESLRKVLADQVSRPSPDFRALLLRTRKQLLLMKECVTEGHPRLGHDAMPAFKEALRCTDVERLDEWPTPSFATMALRHVVDGLIEELSEDGAEDVSTTSLTSTWIDDVWIAETLRDLTDARNAPEEYLARKQMPATSALTEGVGQALRDIGTIESTEDLGNGLVVDKVRIDEPAS